MEQLTMVEYKKRLEEEKKKLETQLAAHTKDTDFGDDVDSFDEEADEAEELSNNLALAQTFRDRLQEIEIALNKMNQEKYGICETCGKPIEERALKNDPAMRVCMHCK